MAGNVGVLVALIPRFEKPEIVWGSNPFVAPR